MDVSVLGAVAASALGSGISLAIFNWYREIVGDRYRRKMEHITQQQEKLYGPTHFLISRNREILRLIQTISDINTKNVGSPSLDEVAQEKHTADIMATVKVNNRYFDEINANNLQIERIFADNYHLVDRHDEEEVQKFVLDCLRRRIEHGESKPTLPYTVTQHLPTIRCFQPDFFDRIALQVAKRSAELERNRNPHYLPLGRLRWWIKERYWLFRDWTRSKRR